MFKPTCFCPTKVKDCPTCSKPDYSKMRPSTGINADLVKARIHISASSNRMQPKGL